MKLKGLESSSTSGNLDNHFTENKMTDKTQRQWEKLKVLSVNLT